MVGNDAMASSPLGAERAELPLAREGSRCGAAGGAAPTAADAAAIDRPQPKRRRISTKKTPTEVWEMPTPASFQRAPPTATPALGDGLASGEATLVIKYRRFATEVKPPTKDLCG